MFKREFVLVALVGFISGLLGVFVGRQSVDVVQAGFGGRAFAERWKSEVSGAEAVGGGVHSRQAGEQQTKGKSKIKSEILTNNQQLTTGSPRLSPRSGKSKSPGNIIADANGGYVLLNPTSGNVGIGTTSPTNILHLNTASNGYVKFLTDVSQVMYAQSNNTTNAYIRLDNSSGNSSFFGTRGVDGFVAGPAGGVWRIETSGGGLGTMVADKVGIGTTSPETKLDILGGNGLVARLRGGYVSTSKNNTQLRFYGLTSAEDLWAIGTDIENSGSAKFQIWDLVGSNDVARLTIQNDGNVGIGTTNPGMPLEVFTGSTLKGFRINRYTSGVYYSDIRQIDNPEGLAFFIGDGSSLSERMRITGAGNVGIGTTSPANKLDVEGTGGGSAGIYMNNAVPSGTSYTLYNNAGNLYWNGAVVSTGGSSISGTTNCIPVFTSATAIGNSVIYQSGSNVGIGTTSPNAKLEIQNSGTTTLLMKNTLASFANTLTTGGSGNPGLYANWNASNAVDDISKPSWVIRERIDSDCIEFLRCPPGGSFSTLAVINSAGNVGIGTTSFLDGSSKFGVAKDGGALAWEFGGHSDTDAPIELYYRSRGTRASPTVVSAEDAVVRILGRAYDGSAYRDLGGIWMEVDGTPGASDMPGRIRFLTTPDGSATLQERMRITNAGNVGIGTTSPGVVTTAGRNYLTLSGSTGAGILEMITQQADADGIVVGGIQFTDKNSVARAAGIFSLLSGTTSNNRGGILSFWTKADNSSTFSEKMRIDNTGNVGIGTTSPAKLLHVKGDQSLGIARIERTTTLPDGTLGSLQLKTTTSANMVDGFGGGIVYSIEDDAGVENPIAYILAVRAGADNSGALTFFTCNAGSAGEQMRILADGKVGVGTVSPDVKLDVDGDIEGDLVSTGSTVAVYAVAGGANGGTYKLVRYSSSKKYKKNITNFNLGLDVVEKLRPVEFNWKSTGERDFGFIAEEAEEVNPCLVTKVNGEVEAFKHAQYTAILTNAIKEQQTEIEELRTENKALEQRIDALEKMKNSTSISLVPPYRDPALAVTSGTQMVRPCSPQVWQMGNLILAGQVMKNNPFNTSVFAICFLCLTLIGMSVKVKSRKRD